MPDKNERQKLFENFPPVSTEQWEAVIKEDLKGADYEKKLIWKTPEGIAVKPYYRTEDLSNLEYLKSNSDISSKADNKWAITQVIFVDDFSGSNRNALNAIQRGVDAINFVIHKSFSENDIENLLTGLNLEKNAMHFTVFENHETIVKAMLTVAGKNKFDTAKISGSVTFDPAGFLTVTGNFSGGQEDYAKTATNLFELAQSLPAFKIVTVNAHYFHNSGASAVQELGMALAVASEYLSKLADCKIPVETVAKKLNFVFATGSNYFMEIAKLRAARHLWARMLEAYSVSGQKMNIQSVTSAWSQTLYDPNVNMLRATTESMSAIIGGTDGLSVLPYDLPYKNPDEFSERVARNTQIVLKEESYLDKVADPSAGSYYIENLTDSIATEAWKLFLEIEEQGGYTSAFKNGNIQKMISATAQKRDMNIAMKSESILGTNQYPNLKEKMLPSVEKTQNLFPKTALTTSFVAIKPYRGSEAFEEIRMKTERQSHSPKVFLLTFGNLAMRKARASFATNFFGCAGFEIIDNPGFKTIDEGIAAAINSKSEIVVICSSDDEYPEIVPGIMAAMKDKAIMVLAGFPKDHVENFKALGLNNFIHIKSNVIDTLKDFQTKLNLK